MPLNLDSLPEAQRALWEAFEEADLSGWVLYGGTALALRYGHRISVDFDFFTGLPISAQGVFARIPWLKANLAEVLQESPNTYEVSVRAPGLHNLPSVKLAFFGGLGLPLIEAPLRADNGLHIASEADLLATKLKVINQRVEAKDYIDIAAILRRSQNASETLAQGLANMHAMYPEGSSVSTLKALCWFENGNFEILSDPDRQLLKEVAPSVRSLPFPTVSERTLKSWGETRSR